MNSRIKGIAAAGAAVAGLSGCAANLVPPTAPNSHSSIKQQIEQIERNYGFGDTLGKLALSQHFAVPIAAQAGTKPQEVDVFNFTPQKVDEKVYGRIVKYDAGLAASAEQWKFQTTYLNQDNSTQELTLSSSAVQRNATALDVVLVPEGTTPPSRALGSSSETYDFSQDNPPIKQTISVVYQPENDAYSPGSFLTDGPDLAVETCQAIDWITSTASSEPRDGDPDDEVERLGQEDVCNTNGDTWQAILDHDDYAVYAESQKSQIGTVPIDQFGGQYEVQELTDSPHEYEQMEAALAGR